MAYTPVAYTDSTAVERMLRVSNNKITIGNEPGQITTDDIEAYILNSSRRIDAQLRRFVLFEFYYTY